MKENESNENGINEPVAFNKPLKMFLIKLVLLVAGWEMLYLLVLKPIRIPDAFLTHTLTSVVTYCLNIMFDFPGKATWIVDNYHAADHIQLDGKTILSIFDDCNALDLYLIYLGFLILLPNTLKRKILFSIIGIASLFVGNIIRCIGLYWVYVYHRSSFEINHHYIFTILMYLIILICWVLYTKKSNLNEAG